MVALDPQYEKGRPTALLARSPPSQDIALACGGDQTSYRSVYTATVKKISLLR